MRRAAEAGQMERFESWVPTLHRMTLPVADEEKLGEGGLGAWSYW